jgi:hypothetical protein
MAPSGGAPSQSVSFLVYPVQGDATGTAVGEQFADTLSAALTGASPRLTSVVTPEERRQIVALLRDQLGGSYDTTGIPKLDEALGFRWSLTPTYDIETRQLVVNARDLGGDGTARAVGVLDMEPQSVLLPAEAQDVAVYDAQICWTMGARNRGELAFREFWDLQVGHDMSIRFSATADRRIYALVFVHGRSRRGLLVFPNGVHVDSAVQKNGAVEVPPPGLDPFRFTEDPGTETVYVVLSPDPLEVDPLYREMLTSPRIRRRATPTGFELGIEETSFVKEEVAARWAAELDQRATDSRVLRGVLQLAQRLQEGVDPANISARDLGRSEPGPASYAEDDTGVSAQRCAPILASGVTVLRFTIVHQ